MTDLKDERYTIEDRQLIAETPDLRVQTLTLACWVQKRIATRIAKGAHMANAITISVGESNV
jgi:hypothetical protein